MGTSTNIINWFVEINQTSQHYYWKRSLNTSLPSQAHEFGSSHNIETTKMIFRKGQNKNNLNAL